MKLLMISGLAGLAVFVAAANMASHPLPAGRTSVAGMPPLQGMQMQRNKLPVEDFADRSLVFPRETPQ
ncbi:hypothetical protein [Bradyrhizobium arachidis]|uniref:Uncharacterized protein n=1 Tax=Bradyrhizobium arachidis TaxID=858423 RepID=A0AAE7THH1_9BRAD|nr:hypothetical protein [Bradyrhizobium arachidis]QOZ68229.1 hypothetical protein WN72_19385 [Bradyrhizobium arachidis]